MLWVIPERKNLKTAHVMQAAWRRFICKNEYLSSLTHLQVIMLYWCCRLCSVFYIGLSMSLSWCIPVFPVNNIYVFPENEASYGVKVYSKNIFFGKREIKLLPYIDYICIPYILIFLTYMTYDAWREIQLRKWTSVTPENGWQWINWQRFTP